MTPGRTEIRIIAQTHSNNSTRIIDWIDLVAYKTADLNYNGVLIGGIFPISHTLRYPILDVILSADYVVGDINLLKLRELRKEKLKKIAECQKQLNR
jgi:hypothetical protein